MVDEEEDEDEPIDVEKIKKKLGIEDDGQEHLSLAERKRLKELKKKQLKPKQPKSD